MTLNRCEGFIILQISLRICNPLSKHNNQYSYNQSLNILIISPLINHITIELVISHSNKKQFDASTETIDTPKDNFDALKGSNDTLKDEFDAPKDEFDAPKDNIDPSKGSIDAPKGSIDALKGEFDAPKDDIDGPKGDLNFHKRTSSLPLNY